MKLWFKHKNKRLYRDETIIFIKLFYIIQDSEDGESGNEK